MSAGTQETRHKPAGVGHFLVQRVTAVALIPLSVWFVLAMFDLVGANRDTALAYLHEPLHAILMGLLVVIVLIHMALGVQVVIEDYVPKDGQRKFFLFLNSAYAWIAGAVCLYAMYRIALP